jgi:hypothetical protein
MTFFPASISSTSSGERTRAMALEWVTKKTRAKA